MMPDITDRHADLFDGYRSLEQKIQGLVAPITHRYCTSCGGACCREEICRESIQSPFLNKLVQMQGLAYDDRSGWLVDTGCRLSYGRPHVCYAYFCGDVATKQPNRVKKADTVIKAFSAIGNRAVGGTHLISIENLDELSFHNISKIINKILQVHQMISAVQ